MATDKELVTLLHEKEEQIRTVIPTWIDRDRFMAATYELRTQWLKDDNLRKCTAESLINCVYESARTGLEFAAKHAYVVAYGTEATFMPGYRGKIYLKLRSGAVKSIVADIVYENDEFYVERNSDDPAMMRLVHRYAKGPRGKPIASYAMAKLANDIVDFEVCYKERVERSRAKSKQPSGLMWGTFWEEAWKKTAIHALDKRLPEGIDPEFVKAYRLAQLLEAKHEPIEPAELSEEERPRAKDSTAEVRGDSAEGSAQPKTTVRDNRGLGESSPDIANRDAQASTAGDSSASPPEPRVHTVLEAIKEVADDQYVDADQARKIEDWFFQQIRKPAFQERQQRDPMLVVNLLKSFGIGEFRELKVSQLDDFKAAIEGR